MFILADRHFRPDRQLPRPLRVRVRPLLQRRDLPPMAGSRTQMLQDPALRQRPSDRNGVPGEIMIVFFSCLFTSSFVSYIRFTKRL